MIKNSCRGWKDVFSFTLSQTFKSKPYLIVMLLMFVFSLISMPLLSMVTKNPAEAGEEKSSITKASEQSDTVWGACCQQGAGGRVRRNCNRVPYRGGRCRNETYCGRGKQCSFNQHYGK